MKVVHEQNPMPVV